MEVTIKISRTRKSSLPLPHYKSADAAGLDVVADLDQEIVLAQFARAAIPTGLCLEIPQGYEGQVRPRSGRAIDEGLTLINSPGTVDADYRGELKILVVNLGDRPINIRPGDRIAQLVIAPVIRARIVEVESLESSTRGEGGFGHTGR